MARWDVLHSAIGLVALALLGLLAWLLTGPSAPVSLPLRDAPAREALLVTGSRTGAALAEPLGAVAVVHEGSGFAVDPGLFTTLPADLEGREPAAVVLQAGESDTGARAGAPRTAVEQMIDRLRAELGPGVPLVVVGPVPDGGAGPGLLRVRDEVQAAARAKGVPFVDPVELGADATTPGSLAPVVQAVEAQLAPPTPSPATTPAGDATPAGTG